MTAATAVLECLRCGAACPLDQAGSGCRTCAGPAASNLRVRYPDAVVRSWNFGEPAGRGMWRFAAMLPVAASSAVTLGEGATPLLEAPAIARAMGMDRLHVKDETRNPTQSYKDRLSAVAVSYAMRTGKTVVATASSGNAGASLAAYAAKAGLRCVVASMAGASGPMLAQIRKFGAQLVLLTDKHQRWPFLAAASQRNWFVTSPYTTPVVGSTPIGIEGYKTIAYEIVQDLGRAPDWLALPVCYGDALAGIHQGFEDLLGAGVVDHLPRFIAAEAHGSLQQAQRSGADSVAPVAAAYAPLAGSVAAVQSTYQALRALQRSHGLAVRVDNEGLVAMQDRIAQAEGLFLELASVLPFVALRRLRDEGIVAARETVVCLATASGLKDLDRSGAFAAPLPTAVDSVEAALAATATTATARAPAVRTASLSPPHHFHRSPS